MIWILCFHGWQRTFHFFFIKIENFRGEGKILMRHTHDTTFSEDFLEESEQFFILRNFIENRFVNRKLEKGGLSVYKTSKKTDKVIPTCLFMQMT
jgi:hypothetical protein